MKKRIYFYFITSCLILSGCSIQMSGLSSSYHEPNTQITGTAKLTIATNNATLVSIDGKSVNQSTVTLIPGKHQLTLYIGKNNYEAQTNLMVIVNVIVQANNSYVIRSKGSDVWVEDTQGTKVSSPISKMRVTKSIKL